jgi:photosystem II stability/assembly factor-like uncharacterized protein
MNDFNCLPIIRGIVFKLIVSSVIVIVGDIGAVAQQWMELGPAPIGDYRTSGRISAIATSDFDEDTYYIGGADGGVWKSTDAGTTWAPLTDYLPTTAIGAVALGPYDDRVVFVGSGEANFANHSRYGLGLYKSTDGGDTWEVHGEETFGGRCFSRIVIDAENNDVIHASITHAGGLPSFDFNIAGARGHPGAEGPLGVFKSTDGGERWEQMTNGIPIDLSATDLAMDPLNPHILYAAIGHVFGDSRNGVYKSTDSGSNWVKLQGGLPTSNVGRISLAMPPADSQRIYASIVRACDSYGGGAYTYSVYRSDDGGLNWISKYPGSIHSSYGWYLNTIIASPTDPDIAFTGGIYLYRTTDGGDSWDSVQGSQHVDMHALAFDSAERLLSGNDGGIYRSSNLGNSWTILNEGLGIIQFYAGISLDPTDPDRIYGGTQDNGTLKRYGPDRDHWDSIFGGDGGYTGVNPINPGIVFCEYQGTGNLYRSNDYGNTFTWSGTGINSGDRNCFLPPYDFDPFDPTHMYYATHRLYESTNGGVNWTPISDDLTQGGLAAIRSLAVAPSDPDIIYVGTNDGLIQVSFNGGYSWNLQLTDVPGWPRVMRPFAVDPDDGMICYLVISYFGVDQILMTGNGGSTWDPLIGNLPDIPVNTVDLDSRFEPPVLYIGTDAGTYMSADNGQTWITFGDGLPNCAVIDLRIDTADNRMVVATQGRGMWEIKLPEGASIKVEPHSFDFAVDMLEARTDLLTVSNTGVEDLSYQLDNDERWLDFGEYFGHLSPGMQEEVEITVTAEKILPGTYTDTLRITSNDPRNPLVKVPVILIVSSPIAISIETDQEVRPGEYLNYHYQISNLTEEPITLEAWLSALRTNGKPIPWDPVAGPRELTIVGGDTIEGDSSVEVPSNTPPGGPYTLLLRAGQYPYIVTEDSSQFYVLSSITW